MSLKTIKSQKGFTLIELLIVIVNIGILAGVLIAIINPTAQQNRAQDAAVQASINKVALATQGYVSAYGSVPNESAFTLGLSTTVDTSGTGDCTGTADYTCMFEVSGIILPIDACDTDGYSTGTGPCYFVYVGTAATTTFHVYAKSIGSSGVFDYDSTDSSLTLIAQP